MEKYVKSPLNYTGGKYKLLEQILPLFPNKINTFYDMFLGGANVLVNVDFVKCVGVDTNRHVISLFNYFLKKDINYLIKNINEIIEHYNLSNTELNGYEFYNCNSSSGLASYNKNNYLKLRCDYNNKTHGFDSDLVFYVLIVFGFNNQIRFNKKGMFNMPVGKRDFNKNIKEKLISFHNKIVEIKPLFLNQSFSDVNIEDLNKNDFFYADPPYLISTATYNESGGWSESDENLLLEKLKCIDSNGGRFALSNIIKHKGMENKILKNWVDKNSFNMHFLNFNYKNSSYHLKDKKTETIEVLVTNYSI